MKTLKDAIELIMAEPPEMHYPAYFANLLRQADVPDKDVGKCSEIPNSSDLRQQAIDLLDEQIAICDRALTNPGISMNDEFAVKVEKRSLIAYREKLECLLSTEPENLKHCSEAERRTDGELIDRQAAIDALRDKFKRTPTNAIRAMDAVKQLPPAEPRERLVAKIEVSEEQIRDALEKMRNEPVQIMPPAQPERILYANMSDAEFEKWLYEHGICNPNIHESIPCGAVPLLIDSAISEWPSAQLERKKGKWIVDALANNIYHCSECGTDAPVEPTGGTEYKSNYCPYCGLDMRGETDED